MTSTNVAIFSPAGTVREMLLTVPTQDLAAPAVEAAARSVKPVKRAMLMTGALSRMTTNMVGTVQLLGAQTDPDDARAILQDIFDMQSAVTNQSWKLSQDWWKGLQQITLDWLSIREANTMSKAVEQDYNVVGQLMTLITDQATNAVTLVESANVGYGYWLSQKLSQAKAA